ncbi:MAG: DUF1015 domain-containing protein [Flavobacteriales bacterium]|nr:DUF1015 domain-containing protein [Flavobacteriales bacterium]MCB9168271.1 DUF1015 domain-containing protein [Flavobacteriales bacterium]
MITIRPFRAWRPAPDKAHLVGSRSFVSYTDDQLREKLAGNPYSFLHVIHPDLDAPPPMDRHERFHRVRMRFKAFCDEGTLLRDEAPCIYLYEQWSRGEISRGIITAISIADYREGRVKVHEQTLTAREELFAEYLEATAINAEPVLLATPEGHAWEALLDPWLAVRPDFDFSTTDRVRHRLWAIADVRVREDLQRAFAEIPAIYIADGHHRMASSARLAGEHGTTDVDPDAWCLAFIVPRSHLRIVNYDRAVTTLNGLDETTFLKALQEIGPVVPLQAPWSSPGHVAVRTESGWHQLDLTEARPEADPAGDLDAAVLSDRVLGPVLGITDLRTDPRVLFVPGTHGVGELERSVDSGTAKAAFHLHPVSFSDLKAVSDSGGSMPPKSTYIEPKLRSGLTIYSLEDV